MIHTRSAFILRRTPRALSAVLLASGLCLAQDTTWIRIDASGPAESLATSSLPGWTPSVLGRMVDSGTHILPGPDGLRVDGFRHPRGSWHLVARIRPDGYGIQESWFLSNLASTSSWPNMGNGYTGTIQGFDVRLGGGRFYPQARRDPAVSDADWQASLDYFDHDRNAALSRCLLGLAVATTDPVVNWKEVYSNRCVRAGVWQDLAVGWDGRKLSMYLDGVEVADTNRMSGAGLVPRLDSVTTLFLGIRGDASYDRRKFSGAIQSLQIRSGELDAALAQRLHLQAQGTVAGSCRAIPEIVEPRTLHLVAASERILLRLIPSPDCKPGLVPDLVLRPGDSLDLLAISLDAFQRTLGTVRIGAMSTPVASLGMDSDSAIPFRLKARLVRASSSIVAAGRSRAAEEPSSWNDDRPMVMLANATGARRSLAEGDRIRLLPADRVSFPGAKSLSAGRMDGSRVPLPAIDPERGLFDLSGLSKGVWILHDGRRGTLVARP